MDSTSMDGHNRVRRDLIDLAERLAGFWDMAIAGEGNVSATLSADRFLVKASGTNLGALESQHLVEVRALPLLDALQRRDDMADEDIETLLLEARADPEALKPSVESLFHAWLLALDDVEVVGHTHPVAVNALICSRRAREYALRRLFPDQVVYCGPESVLVPYVDPGFQLALAIREGVTRYRKASGFLPRIILIENHGAIALGKTTADVAAGIQMAEKSARVFIDAAAVGGPVFMTPEHVARIDGRIDEHYRQRVLQGDG